jgi:hypothetical protein
MIFATNKLRDSYGGYDLYKTRYHFPNWTNPENLGPKVNTAGDEIYPFISRDGKLYFSSDGIGAFGDQDVFVTGLATYMNDDPRPLDAPINSQFDDFGFIINSLSGLGMYMSNRAQRAKPDEFFFQQIYSDCPAKVVFDSVPEDCSCNDSLYCVKLDVMDKAELGDVRINYEWDMGDGTKMKGPQTTYCYKEAGIYRGSVRFKVVTKKAKVIERSFPLEFDLRNRGELILKRSDYRMSTIISARNSKCNGCEEVNYYWKIGRDRFRCGPLIEVFNLPDDTPYQVVMEYRKGGKLRRIICKGKI